jgi:DNA/RNA-binding domain of Phe-tRNA-synthetase-like protein
MKTNLIFSIPPSQLRIGLIEAINVCVGPTDAYYKASIEQETAHILKDDFQYPDHIRKGIRSLLKTFGFHPSGRSRPASEFLVKDLINRKEFNSINNIVDINNHLSLKSHLPISVLDLDKTGTDLCIRTGLPDEKYIFNKEGQLLSLKNLILVADQSPANGAYGSPVKDSQATKIFAETKNILGIIYTSANITPVEELESLLEEFANHLQKQAKAEKIDFSILDAPK